MLARSLRRGDRNPKPGAILVGCARPKAIRFASPFGGASPFGDGSYSGNILQNGVALQPQDYLLDGVTPLRSCIVYTEAATVQPDAQTGAAAFTCWNLVGIGASASLSASANCKALLGFVLDTVALRGGARLHMNRLGRAGNFGDITAMDLLPARIRGRVCLGRLRLYTVKGEGAAGGARTAPTSGNSVAAGNNGIAAGPMQTGGGGGGSAIPGNAGTDYGGAGGKGGPCCGGASGSPGFSGWNGSDAGDFGGPGGAAIPYVELNAMSGGGGDPAGANKTFSYNTVSFQALAGGGLLGLFAVHLDIASGCLITADGSPGTSIIGGGYGTLGGPGTGGGCVVIVTAEGGYSNAGTVRTAGGAKGTGLAYDQICGDGGAGSVNIFEISA